VVGEQHVDATVGDLIVAPAGVPHGVARAAERTIVLMAMAPAPTGGPGGRGGHGAGASRDAGTTRP
jgi:quercetin dioxygenase-like cupin family protein